MELEQILPQQVLEKQVCQECFRFLSVRPIVNKGGQNICGRCIKNDPVENYVTSLFNVAAEKFQFKCMNYLNGCKETLPFAEIELHEAICSHYQIEECLLCSFSGNLAQILYHSLKAHVDVTYLNEYIQFLLSDDNFSKAVLLVLNDTDMVLGKIEITDEMFRFTFRFITTNKDTSINQYDLKIFSDDPLNAVIHGDNILLSRNLRNFFEKSKQELKLLFGPVAQLNLRILFDHFTIEERELALHKRKLSVQKVEEHLYNLKADFERKRRKLDADQHILQSVMEEIKIMSYNLFKCRGCNKDKFEGFYVCPKMHCYCKTCKSDFCTLCNTVRKFKFKHVTDMKNFKVACDWPSCTKLTPLRFFLQHKSDCVQRPYKCPLQDCMKFVYSVDELIKHWHCQVPALIVNRELLLNHCKNAEYYLFAGSDLYHIIVNFTSYNVEVLVEENSVLVNREVKCEGSKNQIGYPEWTHLPFSTFCGHKTINHRNNYEKLRISFGLCNV